MPLVQFPDDVFGDADGVDVGTGDVDRHVVRRRGPHPAGRPRATHAFRIGESQLARTEAREQAAASEWNSSVWKPGPAADDWGPLTRSPQTAEDRGEERKLFRVQFQHCLKLTSETCNLIGLPANRQCLGVV